MLTYLFDTATHESIDHEAKDGKKNPVEGKRGVVVVKRVEQWVVTERNAQTVTEISHHLCRQTQIN